MSTTLIKLNGSSGDLKEMTTAEEAYIAYQVSVYLASTSWSNTDTGTIINSIIATHQPVGAFANTYYNQAVGTHPGTSLSIGTTTTTLKQNATARSETGLTYPISWNTSGTTGINQMTSAELDAVCDRILDYIVSNEWPGSLRISTSTPSGYALFRTSIFSDTRADGTTAVYNLYKKTTLPTLPTVVRPIRLNGTSGDIKEMTDAEIKSTFAQRVINRMISTNDRIGRYVFNTGTPTSIGYSGTWVERGTVVDTRNITSEVDYQRNSTTDFSANYQRNSTTGFTGTYVHDYIGDYTGNYVHDYLGNFAGTYVHDYIGDYTGNYIHDYIGDYIGTYVHDYIGDYVHDYIGNFAGAYLGDLDVYVTYRYRTVYYINPYGQAPFGRPYAGDLVYAAQGAQGNAYMMSGAHYGVIYAQAGGNVSTRESRANPSQFWTWRLDHAYARDAYFVGNYTRNRLTTVYKNRTANVDKTFQRNTTIDFSGNYLLNSTTGFTGNYENNSTTDFSANYQLNSTTGFTGTYVHDYIGDYVGNYVHDYLGNYVGTTLTSSSSTINTYKLYVRVS